MQITYGRPPFTVAGAIFILLTAVAGCNRDTETAGDARVPATAPESAPASETQPPARRKTACGLLPASEVDLVLGTRTTAEAEEGGGTTACTYTATGRSIPSMKLEIDWDTGRMAMMSSEMLGRLEPGVAAAVNELGDAASQIGPVLWIRVGEHLVRLTFFGVDDSITAAKRLMAVLRPRL